jgi:hypothetical protein
MSVGGMGSGHSHFPTFVHFLAIFGYKVPLHSWKQEKITGFQVRGVGGRYKTALKMLCGRECCPDAEATRLTTTIRGVYLAQHHTIASAPQCKTAG